MIAVRVAPSINSLPTEFREVSTKEVTCILVVKHLLISGLTTPLFQAMGAAVRLFVNDAEKEVLTGVILAHFAILRFFFRVCVCCIEISKDTGTCEALGTISESFLESCSLCCLHCSFLFLVFLDSISGALCYDSCYRNRRELRAGYT